MHPIPIEIICYHCQQSAEKYLKGYLVFYGMIPPKTHDLDELCKLCTKSNNKFRGIADFCSDLTAYGVQPGYPMELYLEEQNMYQALKAAWVKLNKNWYPSEAYMQLEKPSVLSRQKQ